MTHAQAFSRSKAPALLSLCLVLFDHRLQYEWSIDNIAMCFVYYLALSRMYSNSRRNFICRMRCGKEETESLTRGKDNRLKLLDDEYAIVHCTGYIKVGLLKINIYNKCINKIWDSLASLDVAVGLTSPVFPKRREIFNFQKNCRSIAQ